jgi:hypothetical protein
MNDDSPRRSLRRSGVDGSGVDRHNATDTADAIRRPGIDDDLLRGQIHATDLAGRERSRAEEDSEEEDKENRKRGTHDDPP